ncbi:MAG TPA: histidine--tRNA ligase [Gemmatimonadaceae bacterium]|nr:histidine--tRNA ligase [Gemmatimonadaceae bacterium]
MSTGALPGFRDFFPSELAARSAIFATWREVARRYGFVEYDGPPLEPLELYTRKSGEEIAGQLYNFVDKGGREVALRPEMTPTLARMAGARANALRKPVRWFSIPQLFRYERQQRGRLREHFQLNVDIIGEPSSTADAELLSVALDIMRSFGLTPADVVARVSDRRILQGYLAALGVGDAALPAVFAVIDKLDRQPRAVSDEKLAAAGIGDEARERILALPAATLDDVAELLVGTPVESAVEEFRSYLGYLEALGVAEWVKVDFAIVRGLAYYTGIVFELFDARGELRAICGGGRYDTLLKALGGTDLPALGFGMGDVVLGELLRDRSLLPDSANTVESWVAYADEGGIRDAMRVASRLRARGRSVEYALGGQKLARQLRAAASAGAEEAVILTSAGMASGEAVVRRLADGTERHVRLDDWIGDR